MFSNSLWRWSMFLIISALYSCTKNDKRDNPSKPDMVVSVDEAKMAFAQMIASSLPVNDKQAPNAAYNIPDWDSAHWKKQAGGTAFLAVPLQSIRKISRMHRYLNVRAGREDLVTLPDPWLMVYRDSSKHLNFSVVQQIPRKSMGDSTAPRNQQGRFSGEMKVYNWSGNFLYGTQYTNGIRSKRLSPGGRISNNPNARWEYACYTKYICVFVAQCDRYQSNQGFEVIQVAASVETTDGGGCTNSYPPNSPYTTLVEGNASWNMYTCGTWTFYNSSSEEACDSYWVDDDIPGPDPDPDDPSLPSLLYYIHVDAPPPGKVVNITDFLKCFNQTQGAKFTLYSDQPVPNQRIPADVGAVSVDVGHTFVTIEQTMGGTTIKRTFGFYPSVPVDLFTPGTPKVIIDDANHHYDVALSANISATQLANIIYIATHAPAIYNLFSYNCTNYGIQMANAAGMALPFTQNPDFPGCNPGDIGQDMRLKTGVVTTPGLAPAKTGTCP